MKHLLSLVCVFLCVLLLVACGTDGNEEQSGRKSTATGWYLETVEGSEVAGPLIVRDDITSRVEYMVDKSESRDLFDGLESGDRIQITFETPGEGGPWPGVNWVYKCELLEKGTLIDVPEEALTTMEEHGYDFGRHAHTPAEEPQSVEAPVSGYCGNIVTTIHLDGQDYSFCGSDSVTLTDILINLAYDPDQVCKCLPEFTVDTEFSGGYGVNLAESYARCESGQAALTAEQTDAIRDVLERNCG